MTFPDSSTVTCTLTTPSISAICASLVYLTWPGFLALGLTTGSVHPPVAAAASCSTRRDVAFGAPCALAAASTAAGAGPIGTPSPPAPPSETPPRSAKPSAPTSGIGGSASSFGCSAAILACDCAAGRGGGLGFSSLGGGGGGGGGLGGSFFLMSASSMATASERSGVGKRAVTAPNARCAATTPP